MSSKRTKLPLPLYVVKTDKVEIFRMTKLFGLEYVSIATASLGRFPE